MNEPEDIAPWAVGQFADAQAEAAADRHTDELAKERVAKITSGQMIGVASPWPVIDREVRCNLPGTVNVLCGDPGSAKSFLTLQMFRHVQAAGVKCAIHMLEGSKDWHAMRLLAQLAGEPGMTDIGWVAGNPRRAESVADLYSFEVRAFGRCLWCNPEGPMTQKNLIKWVEERCEDGCKLIGVDPVTALIPSETPWLDDFALIQRIRRAVERFGVAAWIVTHPKKGRKTEISMDVLSGGAAFSRFTDTVLWLERPEVPMTHILYGGATVDGDRVLHVLKARDGVATGRLMSMSLRKDRLTFDAHGWIKEMQDAAPEDDQWANV